MKLIGTIARYSQYTVTFYHQFSNSLPMSCPDSLDFPNWLDVSCWLRKVRAKPFSSHRAFRSPGFSCSDRKGSAKPQLGPKLCCTHIRLDWKMHCKCSKLFKPKNEANLHLGSTPWSTSSRLGGPLYCFSSSNVSYWRQLSGSSPQSISAEVQNRKQRGSTWLQTQIKAESFLTPGRLCGMHDRWKGWHWPVQFRISP